MKKILHYLLMGTIIAGGVSFAAAWQEIGIQTAVRNGIALMSGGVGQAERAEMEQMAQGYNLKIVLARASGNYLARLPLTVHDDQGQKVLEVEAAGPWIYLQLPEGRYTVKAEYHGIPRARTLDVTRDLQWMMFHWGA
ncbi:MAG: hypothetical protein WBG37_19630 [Desulfobacterales bacterium]